MRDVNRLVEDVVRHMHEITHEMRYGAPSEAFVIKRSKEFSETVIALYEESSDLHLFFDAGHRLIGALEDVRSTATKTFAAGNAWMGAARQVEANAERCEEGGDVFQGILARFREDEARFRKEFVEFGTEFHVARRLFGDAARLAVGHGEACGPVVLRSRKLRRA